MQDRVLPLWGIHNFRDYGGYAMRGGATLKRGVLWRSGQHVDATSDDLEAVSNSLDATLPMPKAMNTPVEPTADAFEQTVRLDAPEGVQNTADPQPDPKP